MIYGVGKSGTAAAKLLLSKGFRVFLYDDKSNAPHVEGAISLRVLEDDLINKLDLVVISPGVPLFLPEVMKLAEKTKIVGELEVGFRYGNGTLIALTGTNGKTTTCTLIDYILKTAGKKSRLLGNAGVPYCTASDADKDTFCVVETSSFQLETIDCFHPHIAAILNLAPDHIDRHGDFANYADTKFFIFRNQTQDDFAVINADDEEIAARAKGLKAQKLLFSLCDKTADAFCDGKSIFFRGKKMIELANCGLTGMHNAQNMLCAACVAKLCGVDDDALAHGLKTFSPVKHRLQKIGSIGGVDFVNDSKATNPASVLPAMSAFDHVCVIMGGSDKGCEFDRLFQNVPQNVAYCVFTGQTREKLFQAAKRQGFTRVLLANDFRSAVKIAYEGAKPKGTVLLSPACASFDSFKNFEERGAEFEKIFRELKAENTR